MKIRPARSEDAAAIAAIYAPYVTETVISFELEPPDEAVMRERIQGGGALYPWLVACGEGETPIGYAAASAFRSRPAYRFTVETSVYLAPDAAGRGIGRALYSELLGLLERQGFAQAIGAITLPNEASVRLHESLGFVAAGIYRDVGYKLGRWHSVGLWQRPLAPFTERPAEPRPFADFL